MLTNADFKYAPATDGNGQSMELTEGAFWKILATDDRAARQNSWDIYMNKHLEFKNTLASNLANSIKQNIFQMKARKHQSSLAASLYQQNVPVEVFHNLIETFKKNLPVWHRYFRIRKKGLGVSELHPYDMWAPLTKNRIKIPFEQAVDWIAAGLLPLGKEYVSVLRDGCFEQRWVDVYPNLGKRTGAFSWGVKGTHPFIMMSYTDEIFSLSTLAHELGHSMHSYLTWDNQPLIYSDYSLFVAEVASNFNQAMVRSHLLQANPDRDFQISIIEEAMANFYRYFFIMPTLARFELATHEYVEQGEALNAEIMIDTMADLFLEGYGDAVTANREQVGITWAYFPHLFNDYYVYQYATGISGAHALSGRVLRGEENAVKDYLGFLKAGSSGYPLDVLRKAGVDLASPQPVEETFAVMSGYIDQLEKLLG
jgi:oligoendopeptidase F